MELPNRSARFNQSALKVLVAILFALFVDQVSAKASFQCVANEFREVSNVGRASDNSDTEKLLKETYGKEHYRNFFVNADKAEISGPYLFNTKNWKTTILDPGSSEQSFKLLMVSSGGHVNIKLLQIYTYDKADRKPFLFIDGKNVVSGTCVKN